MYEHDPNYIAERQSYFMEKLIKLHNDIVDLAWSGDKQLQQWVCMEPFNTAYIINNGIVTPCALFRIKYGSYFGNLHNDSLEDIWNSDNAKRLRYSVSKGNFEYCDRVCPVLMYPAANPGKMLPRESVEFKYNTWHDCSLNTGPTFIHINFDLSCNLYCTSCREHVKINTDEENKKVADMLEKLVRPALKTCKWLQASGGGEFFASKPILEFYRTLTPKEFPLLKLIIYTNGILFTPERWNSLQNLKGMLHEVKVSIDAATKDTYERLRRGARWEMLCDNMGYISSLKSSGEVSKITMCFVVQSANFREMRGFVELAKKWQADEVVFQPLRNLGRGTYPDKSFSEQNVSVPENPHYDEVVKELKSLIQEKELTVRANFSLGNY
jgi:MoaA/NifB/PqqE/SkfB family radical SAM enzyme